MKKKIITLALAVVMCLSVITSVTAADTLNRVASTIPGTDIEYNYVENVTVQIPDTEVTFELKKVAEKVGVSSYANKYPIYVFEFYEEDSKVIFNQEGKASVGSWWWLDKENNMAMGEYAPEEYNYSYFVGSSLTSDFNGGHNDIYAINILDDGTCTDIDTDGEIILRIEFEFNVTEGKKYSKYMDISEMAVIESPAYSIIEGANSVVNSNKNALTIKADGDFDKFTGVKVDGEIVDSSNYTATEGSTVIEFKAEYLKTLDAGEHTVSVVFTDGEATTKFEIEEDKNTNNTDKNENTDNLVTDVEIPNTDYNTSVAAAFVAMTISGMALIGLKKKK